MRARLKLLVLRCAGLAAVAIEHARHALLLALLAAVFYAGLTPAALVRRAVLGTGLPPEESRRGWQPVSQQAGARESAFARSATMLGFAARAAREKRWFAAALIVVLAPLAPLAAPRRGRRVNPDLYVMF
jgi:hypothetical protein